MIYERYYSNIEQGKINLNNVNFSCYIVDKTYSPEVSHRKADVTGRIETIVKVLVGGDISSLTMSEITDKISSKLSEDELKQAYGFVVYDISTGDLCFYENFNNVWQQDIG